MTERDRARFAVAMGRLHLAWPENRRILSEGMPPAKARGAVAEQTDAYFQALSDLPIGALELAVEDWLKVGRFFPKPVELAELAREHIPRLAPAPSPRALPEYLSLEQHEANRRFIQGLIDSLKRKLASPAGRTDGGARSDLLAFLATLGAWTLWAAVFLWLTG